MLIVATRINELQQLVKKLFLWEQLDPSSQALNVARFPCASGSDVLGLPYLQDLNKANASKIITSLNNAQSWWQQQNLNRLLSKATQFHSFSICSIPVSRTKHCSSLPTQPWSRRATLTSSQGRMQ